MGTAHLLPLACALLASACVASPPPPDDAGPEAARPAACDAQAVAQLVGQPFSAGTAGQARHDSGSRTVRVIKPGMPVTTDYRDDRLNVHVDDLGVITQLTCG